MYPPRRNQFLGAGQAALQACHMGGRTQEVLRKVQITDKDIFMLFQSFAERKADTVWFRYVDIRRFH